MSSFPNIIRVNTTSSPLGVHIQPDPINDPYIPPLKTDGTLFPPLQLTRGNDIYGLPAPVTNCGMFGCNTSVPVNVATQSVNTSYSQVGILTKDGGESRHPLILPLMGRSLWNGRDKWQYYTMANTAAVNTKLPIKVKGRSCTDEYGCNEVSTGDMVYVEGFNDIFRATIYDNAGLAYLPI